MLEAETPSMEQAQGSEPVQPDTGEKGDKQDLYDIFVSQGILAVSKLPNKTTKDINQIANLMVTVVNKIEGSGAKHGYKFPVEVVLHGSSEILQALLNLSGIKLSTDELKQVMSTMVGLYLDQAVKAGRMTAQQVSELGKQAQSAQSSMQQTQGNEMPNREKETPPKNIGLLGGQMNG